MDKHELIALGVAEDVADKVLDKVKETYIPKARFNEVNEARKSAEATIVLLKENEKTSEQLKADLERVKQEGIAALQQKDAEIAGIKLYNAVSEGLRTAGAKNTKVIMPLIKFDSVALNDNGEVVGLSEQIEALKSAEDSAFLFVNNDKPSIKGASPVVGDKPNGAITKEQFAKMGYSERLELFNTNPDAYKELTSE